MTDKEITMSNEEIIMNNKVIIGRLEDMHLSLKKFKSGDGEHLMDIADRSKIYILGLWLDKKDENFRKGVINMIDEYRTKICSRDSENNMSIKYSLINILQGFINVMELKDEDFWEEEDVSKAKEDPEVKENNTPEEGKKSKNKKSD